MAWVWWLLAPVASTALGAIVIWWRSSTGTGHRLRRADPIAEHQALLRALEHEPRALLGLPVTAAGVAAEQPDR
jgi:hypothetical protein